MQYRCHTTRGRLEVQGTDGAPVVFTMVPALYEMSSTEANSLTRKWGDRCVIELMEDPISEEVLADVEELAITGPAPSGRALPPDPDEQDQADAAEAAETEVARSEPGTPAEGPETQAEPEAETPQEPEAPAEETGDDSGTGDDSNESENEEEPASDADDTEGSDESEGSDGSDDSDDSNDDDADDSESNEPAINPASENENDDPGRKRRSKSPRKAS